MAFTLAACVENAVRTWANSTSVTPLWRRTSFTLLLCLDAMDQGHVDIFHRRCRYHCGRFAGPVGISPRDDTGERSERQKQNWQSSISPRDDTSERSERQKQNWKST
jgi:hypothetical protein